MPATPESRARTRAFARVIGPFLAIVSGIIAARSSSMGTILADYFKNTALVWISGGMLLFFGVLIIANHQYWSSPAAIVISLLGWVLALRGVAVLAVPQLMERAATAAMKAMPAVQAGFGVMMLVGLWLAYVGWIGMKRD